MNMGPMISPPPPWGHNQKVWGRSESLVVDCRSWGMWDASKPGFQLFVAEVSGSWCNHSEANLRHLTLNSSRRTGQEPIISETSRRSEVTPIRLWYHPSRTSETTSLLLHWLASHHDLLGPTNAGELDMGELIMGKHMIVGYSMPIL